MRKGIVWAFVMVLSVMTINRLYAQEDDEDMNPNPSHNIGAAMPSFLVDYNGTRMSDKDFKEKENLVLFLINPTCGHCMEMGHRMDSLGRIWTNTAFLFVVAQDLKSYIPGYINGAALEKHSPDYVVADAANLIDTLFEYRKDGLPQINIYNRDRKLVKKFYSTTPVDSIIAYLKK